MGLLMMTHEQYKAITEAFKMRRLAGLTHKEDELLNDLVFRIAFNLYKDEPNFIWVKFMTDTGLDKQIAYNVALRFVRSEHLAEA